MVKREHFHLWFSINLLRKFFAKDWTNAWKNLKIFSHEHMSGLESDSIFFFMLALTLKTIYNLWSVLEIFNAKYWTLLKKLVLTTHDILIFSTRHKYLINQSMIAEEHMLGKCEKHTDISAGVSYSQWLSVWHNLTKLNIDFLLQKQQILLNFPQNRECKMIVKVAC